MSKAKVSGGFKKNWISMVRNSPGANQLVSSTAKGVMQDAEMSMQLEGALQGYGFHYYYGSVEKKGKNGKTFVFWPTNSLSNEDKDGAFGAAKNAGLITAEEAKARRNS